MTLTKRRHSIRARSSIVVSLSIRVSYDFVAVAVGVGVVVADIAIATVVVWGHRSRLHRFRNASMDSFFCWSDRLVAVSRSST